MKIILQEKKLELKYAWSISRNTSAYKTNFFVCISHQTSEGFGEVAPNIRYGETPELVREQFERFVGSIAAPITDFETLRMYLDMNTLCNALRFGIESAFVHWHCHKTGVSVPQLLGIEQAREVATTYSLPIMELEKLEGFIEENNLFRFPSLKVKVNTETAYETLKEIQRITNQPIMLDANEAWTDVEELIFFLKKIKKMPILFAEQPMPAALQSEYLYLKKYSPFEIMADESVTDYADFAYLKQGFHGVNMKLMKAGGYFNGLAILQEARKNGLKTMIGCMIESSLGISSAMNLCALANYIDLDGFMILQQDPFGLMYEQNGKLRSK